MPEAVQAFIESGSLSGVLDVHRSIAETYQDDFSKYAPHTDLVRLRRVFAQIPRNIGRKIKYVNLSREERAREIKACVEVLTLAQVCQKVVASHCSGIPLAAESDDEAYKLIFMDVGRAVRQATFGLSGKRQATPSLHPCCPSGHERVFTHETIRAGWEFSTL